MQRLVLCLMGIVCLTSYSNDEHLDLLLWVRPTCSLNIAVHGLVPGDQHEEKFSADNAVATDLWSDSIHLNRLFEVVKRIRHDLQHSNYIDGIVSDRLPSAKFVLQTSWKHMVDQMGPAYIASAFGPSLPHLLEGDQERALDTRAALLEMKQVFLRLAWAVKYVSTWRVIWMGQENRSGNTRIVDWAQELNETAPGEFIERFHAVSAATEKALPPRSHLYRLKPSAPVTLENWDAAFPTQHLPEIARRTVVYLKDTLEHLPLIENPVLQALLSNTSKHLHAFNALVAARAP